MLDAIKGKLLANTQIADGKNRIRGDQNNVLTRIQNRIQPQNTDPLLAGRVADPVGCYPDLVPPFEKNGSGSDPQKTTRILIMPNFDVIIYLLLFFLTKYRYN